MGTKKQKDAKIKAEKLKERALAIGLPADSILSVVVKAENSKAKAGKDAKDAQGKKAEEGTKSKVPTSESLINRIKACKSVKEIKAIEPDVIEAYGETIPDEINVIAEAKMKEFIESANKKEKDIVKKIEWKVVTIAEKDEAEKNGTLRGWNQRTLEALIG